MPGNSNFLPNEKSQLFNWLLAISDKNFLLKLLKFWRVGGDSNPRLKFLSSQKIHIMNEPLSELIRIRVTPRQYQNLNEAATLSGLKLSEYIRRLLITAESLQSELNQLREITDSLQRSQKAENAILETLFLLRCSVSSDQLSSAQKMLNDLGFKTF